MTRLLVSVRNVDEARAALVGGAEIIDVKEPSRGSLGRADDHIIEEVVHAVAGRVPVSAALGELIDEPQLPNIGLDFDKVGLAGLGDNWRERWTRWSQINSGTQKRGPVLVAYADVGDVEAVLQFTNIVMPAALLLDTSCKDGRTLLDHIPIDDLARLRHRCRVPFAVAGSLRMRDIDQLIPINPDIVAVRGAACRGGRDGVVEADKVRRLATRLAQLAACG